MRHACELMLVKFIPKSTVRAPISKTTPRADDTALPSCRNESVSEGIHKPLAYIPHFLELQTNGSRYSWAISTCGST